MLCAIIAVSLSLICVQGAQGVEVRGLNPEKKSFYKPGNDFTCLDGSATIPFSLVNDDYCDCRFIVILISIELLCCYATILFSIAFP